MQEKINLGDKVKDTITGHTGICTGIIIWLNGCRRIGIQSKAVKDGLPVDVYWVDETTVEVVKQKVKKTIQNEKGGANTRSMNSMMPSAPKM